MLTKLADTRFTPGVPGTPARPAYSACTGGQAPGRYEQVCEPLCIPVGTDPYSGGVQYHCYPNTCRMVWVPNGPETPVVCTQYPATPEIPAVPPLVESVPILAWNAGANSIAELDGNVRVAFTQGRVVGAVIGFTEERDDVTSVDRYSHAFYFFQTPGGQPRFRLREYAWSVTEEQSYVAGDTFELRRVAGKVEYLRNGSRLRRSNATSAGPLSVGSALYATGDAAA